MSFLRYSASPHLQGHPKDAKHSVRVRIAKLQSNDIPEKIGHYTQRVKKAAPGRENGLLLCGQVPGTGKTTIAAALTHILEDEQAFCPCGESDSPFQNYASALVLTFRPSACPGRSSGGSIQREHTPGSGGSGPLLIQIKASPRGRGPPFSSATPVAISRAPVSVRTHASRLSCRKSLGASRWLVPPRLGFQSTAAPVPRAQEEGPA